MLITAVCAILIFLSVGTFPDGGLTRHVPQESGKSVTTIAREVITGLWGNDPERSAALTAKGYNAKEVQAEVNRILNGSAAKPTTTTKEVTSTCVVVLLWYTKVVTFRSDKIE